MTTADVIIIGGGPSGVAAGLALRKQGVPRVVLLEREAYLAGPPATARIRPLV